MNRKLYALLSVLLVASFLLAGCPSSGSAPAEQPTNTPETAAAATDTPAAAAAATDTPAAGSAAAPAAEGGSLLEQALAGAFKGTKVTATGPFTDEDAVKFNEMVKEFEEKTGIDIQYEGSKEFEASISTRVDAGDAPDIVDFPQPGLLANFVKSGKVVDLSKYLKVEELTKSYNQSWLDMAMMDGADGKIMAGVWERVNAKSLVWYPKKAFDEAGYTIPTTWEELQALMDQIASDGDTPWCIGIESGAATGWPATDWMEEFMLRTTSTDNYDKWTRGELPFSSPEVKNAATQVGSIWLEDKYVYGGRAAIATTFFGDAPTPMFENPPKCWLHKQGNFITSFFPKEAKAGVDYDFFYLPGIDPQYGKPVLVAGDIWAAFADRPEVIAVLEWFTKGEHLKSWMQAGGAIAPHLDADLSWYGSDIERKIGQIIQEATAVRFDGSDLMPGQVGAGSFWKGMTDWVSGAADLDTVLKEIDDSWPR